MSTYYHVSTGEIREIDDATHAEWDAEDNPKADVWILQPAPPSYDAATQHPPNWVGAEWLVEEKTPEDIAAETRKVWENTADFFAEFSVPEAEAIAISTHPTVSRLRLRLATWAGQVFSDDPHVSGGLSLLVAVGILTSSRRTEILTKTTP
jgi:hypothetical protein